MKWADKINMKLSSPVTSQRLKKLLDDKRLVVVPAAVPPAGVKRVILVDEVDAYPQPEHQPLTITTRG